MQMHARPHHTINMAPTVKKTHHMTLRKKTWLRSRNEQNKGDLDLQKWLGSLGVEFHWPGYQFMGPGTRLKDRLRSGQFGINRLDRLALIHDIRYSRAKTLKEKHRADREMIASIDEFNSLGDQTWTEWTVGKILRAKVALNIW